MKKIIACLMACFLAIYGLTACSTEKKQAASQKEGLHIVCTNFPAYDFVRQIVGDKATVTMLLKPGAEAHSYEPSPKDIQMIQKSDLFVYVGGDSDEWVDGILDSMDKSHLKTFKMMDAVTLHEEELAEGMQEEDHDHDHHDGKEEDKDHHEDKDHDHHDEEEEPEMDEHVWTSPANAVLIVKALNTAISSLDESYKDVFQKNTDAYVAKLEALDKEFRDVIDNAKRKEIIVGDRFPFLYFVKEFGLKYYAAFPGCAKETEANPATVAFLIDKVKEDGIPVVFHIEMSNEQMSRSIAEATGAKNELLNAVHNVTAEQFKNGTTYIDLMKHNVSVLKEALN